MISLFQEASDLITHLCEEFEINSEGNSGLEREMKSVLSTCSNELFYCHEAIGIFVLKCYLKKSTKITAIQVASFLKRINFRFHDRLQIHSAIKNAKKKLSCEEVEFLDSNGVYLNLDEDSDEVKFEDPNLFDKTQLDKGSNPPRG